MIAPSVQVARAGESVLVVHGCRGRRGRVAVFHGSASYLPEPWFRAQADAVGVELQTIRGGHFFLQEDTARGEAIVRKALT